MTGRKAFLVRATVDQIYLALRLAMVQSISEQGERISRCCWDDPFAKLRRPAS